MKNKIKLVYVVTFIKNVGVYNVVSNLLKNIDKNKYELVIVSCIEDNDENEIKKLKELGINYYCLGFKRKIDAFVFGTLKLKRILKIINPQIVHSHAIIADSIVSRLSKKYKKITTVHCNIEEDYKYHYGKVKSAIILKLHIGLLKKFDEVIGCSKSVKIFLDKYLKASKYVVNCLNTNDYIDNNKKNEIRKKLKINENDIVYTYIGSLSERKNVLELIKNFKSFSKKNEHLLIIGSGPLYNDCVSLATNTIHILGQINKPIDYLFASNIYISFSKSEGMALSAIEAMSCGLVLLLSNIESHDEIFEICKGNYIGESFNSNNFEEKINKIRKNYEKIDRKKISSIKEKKFNIKNMIKGYCEIYENIIK